VQERLGGRLRWAEVASPLAAEAVRALAAAGVALDVQDGGLGRPGFVS
jgi:hypothetical protein